MPVFVNTNLQNYTWQYCWTIYSLSKVSSQTLCLWSICFIFNQLRHKSYIAIQNMIIKKSCSIKILSSSCHATLQSSIWQYFGNIFIGQFLRNHSIRVCKCHPSQNFTLLSKKAFFVEKQSKLHFTKASKNVIIQPYIGIRELNPMKLIISYSMSIFFWITVKFYLHWNLNLNSGGVWIIKISIWWLHSWYRFVQFSASI